MLFIDLRNTTIEGAAEAFAPFLPEGCEPGAYGWETLAAISEEGEPLGILCYGLTEVEIELKWFFVRPDMRMRGIGGRLMDRLLLVLNEANLDLPVFMRVDRVYDDPRSESAWESLYHFSNCYPFLEINPVHNIYSIDSATRKASVNYGELVKRCRNAGDVTGGFFDKPRAVRKEILDELTKHGYVPGEIKDFTEDCVPELCRVDMHDGKCVAAVLVTKGTDNALDVSFLYGNEPAHIINVLGSMFVGIEEKYPDAEFRMETVNERSEAVVNKLFPGVKPSAEQWISEWNYGVPLSEFLEDEELVNQILEEFRKENEIVLPENEGPSTL